MGEEINSGTVEIEQPNLGTSQEVGNGLVIDVNIEVSEQHSVEEVSTRSEEICLENEVKSLADSTSDDLVESDQIAQVSSIREIQEDKEDSIRICIKDGLAKVCSVDGEDRVNLIVKAVDDVTVQLDAEDPTNCQAMKEKSTSENTDAADLASDSKDFLVTEMNPRTQIELGTKIEGSANGGMGMKVEVELPQRDCESDTSLPGEVGVSHGNQESNCTPVNLSDHDYLTSVVQRCLEESRPSNFDIRTTAVGASADLSPTSARDHEGISEFAKRGKRDFISRHNAREYGGYGSAGGTRSHVTSRHTPYGRVGEADDLDSDNSEDGEVRKNCLISVLIQK